MQASRELGLPQQTVWKVLRKRLRMKPYCLQLHQALSEDDNNRRHEFCIQFQQLIEDEDRCSKLIFSDEATFHLSGKVNRPNVRVWGTENPRLVLQHVRDSPKVNVFCAMSCAKVYGPFFFAENTVTGLSYLDMLTQWLMPQLLEDKPRFLFQQDRAPPLFHLKVRQILQLK